MGVAVTTASEADVAAMAAAHAVVSAGPAIQRRLRAFEEVADLLAAAASEACGRCGFDRCLIAGVQEGWITAAATAPLIDRPSDQLRRRLLAAPVLVEPSSLEGELVRLPDCADDGSRRSILAEALDLENAVVAPISPQGRTIALLVVDRSADAPSDLVRSTVAAFAAVVAVSLEGVVLRKRVAELAADLHQLAGSAQALAREVVEAEVELPFDRGFGVAFAPARVSSALRKTTGAAKLLSGRELEVAALLATGRSNRQIADELTLSPATVKTHVARILRKLSAANRAEAAANYLLLTTLP
jgi:DNA-binding CsgD family transcriptional regulator